MDKLEIGMYVRTSKGIAKYLGLGINVLKNDGSSSYKHWKSKHIFNNYIFEEEYGDTLTTLDNLEKLIIGKPSFDVIDLIESGDYVNGYKVIKIFENQLNKNKLLICLQREEDYEYSDELSDYMCDESIHIYNKDIKSIVTHEQFENMKYEIGG